MQRCSSASSGSSRRRRQAGERRRCTGINDRRSSAHARTFPTCAVSNWAPSSTKITPCVASTSFRCSSSSGGACSPPTMFYFVQCRCEIVLELRRGSVATPPDRTELFCAVWCCAKQGVVGFWKVGLILWLWKLRLWRCCGRCAAFYRPSGRPAPAAALALLDVGVLRCAPALKLLDVEAAHLFRLLRLIRCTRLRLLIAGWGLPLTFG